ncbi:HAD family hydrolase [Solimicrobium silvestre]|uniref:HAD-SF-IA-v3: HAD hydrolase, family IA, variant 3 n=1 Tax=Solimicrobium silvestre TaxID=2099400 RepID=A0A2S9GXV6_9BURK|nr:HAD family phosphatase [Solimicrobium silvestre]PRC92552.1 HAD-SF-IA-v3: HAD hydrolase, family IA, variant 3 [Solimicrobium silvestre]
MVEGILWDNDGVLVDTEKLFFQANKDLFAQVDIALTEQHFFDWFLLENRGAWHLLTDHTPDQIKQLRTRRDQIYMQHLHNNERLEISGINELLLGLAPRVPMGIVTSARSDHFELIHSRLDLIRHFRFVVTEEMYSESKPSPEPYLLGLTKLDLPAEKCLVIEDSPRGLHAARAAGIKCIVLRNKMMLDYPFEGAYRVVESVEELSHEINQLL